MNDWWVDVPAARELPDARRVVERAQLVALASAPARSRVGRPFVLVAGGLALASATGAAVAFLGFGDASDRSNVECHTTFEVARGVDFAGTGVELVKPLEFGGGNRAEAVQVAVGRCADLWAQGVLRLGARNAQLPTGHVEEVPPLTACLAESGVAAVFPTDVNLCASLGLEGLSE